MGRRLLQLLAALLLFLSVQAFGAGGSDEARLADIPTTIRFPSSLGEVVFDHGMHAHDLGLECFDCHHETNAGHLTMPHESYFDDFWIECAICHHGTPSSGPPQSCSACHHVTPSASADETLSAKVVVHRSCWTCHDIGTGESSSRSCGFCHREETAVPSAGAGSNRGDRNRGG